MPIEVSLIGLMTAALAGAVSFVSPCVLPLVPGYLSFVSNGVDPASRRLTDRLRVTWPALWFVAGFTTVFVFLGLGAQALGGILLRYSAEANLIGGAVVVVFGLMMTGLVKIPLLLQEFRSLGPASVSGPGSAYLLGLAFAFGWTPCIGPVLGSILTVSALSAGNGAILLAAYGLGLGVPFVLAAILFGNAASVFKRMRYAGRVLNIVAGAVDDRDGRTHDDRTTAIDRLLVTGAVSQPRIDRLTVPRPQSMVVGSTPRGDFTPTPRSRPGAPDLRESIPNARYDRSPAASDNDNRFRPTVGRRYSDYRE